MKSLYDRARRVVTDESDLLKEKKHLNQVLLNNGYLQSFINEKHREVRQCDEENLEKPLVMIPYVSGLSEDIRRICRCYGIIFKSGINIRSQLSKVKDTLPLESQSGVVYEIPCSCCNMSYIGETVRRLGSRVKEHKDACSHCEIEKSALADHAWSKGHPVAWDKS